MLSLPSHSRLIVYSFDISSNVASRKFVREVLTFSSFIPFDDFICILSFSLFDVDFRPRGSSNIYTNDLVLSPKWRRSSFMLLHLCCAFEFRDVPIQNLESATATFGSDGVTSGSVVRFPLRYFDNASFT